ncbi:hypothetical protein Q5752_001435 [Cryptotrichosporon argae]
MDVLSNEDGSKVGDVVANAVPSSPSDVAAGLCARIVHADIFARVLDYTDAPTLAILLRVSQVTLALAGARSYRSTGLAALELLSQPTPADWDEERPALSERKRTLLRRTRVVRLNEADLAYPTPAIGALTGAVVDVCPAKLGWVATAPGEGEEGGAASGREMRWTFVGVDKERWGGAYGRSVEACVWRARDTSVDRLIQALGEIEL